MTTVGQPERATQDRIIALFRDELGYRYVEDGQQMHVHDLHATMLYLCGIDHKRLTFHFQGREFRLTDVSGEVAKGIVA